jgi:pimeloyl-ACP methyl ester carboxylesterase/DNA-binding SARP family transcriptional activator
VPRDRLVDDLWEQQPSPAARHTVQTYVSQLRKLLAQLDDHTALVSRPGGYALELAPGALDARLFERLCTEAGCEPSAARRLELLSEAMALWRSTPLTEFSGTAWADAYATRLDARRLEAFHERIDALLALGRHSEALPDLEDLVREHPLDERFWAQLLVAYFRAGRQSDALRAYQRLRNTLAEELGIAPSRELQELERRLLDQDPSLLGARATSRDVSARPRTQYAMSGELAIAYQVLGDGPIDLLVMPTGYSMMEPSWEWPALANFWKRLARRTRLVLIDQRGMGLSDRVTTVPTPEERMDDVRAVADAVGAQRFALLGGSAGGATSALFAATYPERVLSLVLISPLLLGRSVDGVPGWADDDTGVLWYLHNRWGSGESAELRFAPSLAGDQKAREWVGRMERLAGTPTAMEKVMAMNRKIDVRAAVPTISAPTLVIQRVDDQDVPVEHARYYAEHIPNVNYLELPGRDHWWWVGDNAEEIVQTVEDFLTDRRARPESDRVLKTVMFVDMTPLIAATRDAVAEHRGVEINTAGDHFVACFDGPGRAISCALAIVDAAADAGVEASVALHTGECEVHGDELTGMAVRIGRHVIDRAGPGEVLVTGTVRDLIAGSPVAFEDRGRHRFDGIPGEWQLLLATG